MLEIGLACLAAGKPSWGILACMQHVLLGYTVLAALVEVLGKCKHVLRLLSIAGTASAHQGVYTTNSYDHLQKSDSNAQAHTRTWQMQACA